MAMIDIDVEVHVLGNQMVKIHYKRFSHLVSYERGRSSRTWHILSVSLNTRQTGDAREVLEDPNLK